LVIYVAVQQNKTIMVNILRRMKQKWVLHDS